MRTKTLSILIIIAFILPSEPIRGQPANIVDDVASWTIQKVIKDAKDNKQAKSQLRYRELSVEEEFDTNGVSRSRKPAQGVATRIVDGSQKSRIAGFELDLYDILADRYNFEMANTSSSPGLTIIDGRVYVVIDFAPKAGLKYKSIEDRFINRLHGRIFVDVRGEYYYIKKTEIHIPEEFGFTYWKFGILPVPITIKNFRFTLTQERLEPEGVVVERTLEASTTFDSIRDGRKEYRYNYDNFTKK